MGKPDGTENVEKKTYFFLLQTGNKTRRKLIRSELEMQVEIVDGKNK